MIKYILVILCVLNMLIFLTILPATEDSNTTTKDTIIETLSIKLDISDITKTPDKTMVVKTLQENKSWFQKLSAFTRGYIPFVAWLYHNTSCCSSCSKRATEFIEAVKAGDVSTCEKFMNDSVLVNARDTNLYTALHWAVVNENEDIIKLLFASRNTNLFKRVWYWMLGTLTFIDLENKEGNTALHIAAIHQCDEIIPMLIEQNAQINKKNKLGETPLLCASRKGHATTVSLFLKRNAQLDAVNNKKQNALHIATLNNRETVVNLLVWHKELINIPDNKGNTPLIYAVKKNKCVIAERLLEHGADSSVRTCEGDTLAHLCIKENNLEVFKILIKHKVDINELDNNELTPFDMAVKNDCAIFVELFMNNDVSLKNNSLALHFAIENENHNIIEKILLYKPELLNIPNVNGMTPLQFAVMKGYIGIVKTLLYHKADITHRTNDGETALSLAAAYGHVSVIRLLANYTAVNINSQNNKKQTPLMKSVMHCHSAAFKTLLELGAYTEITDYQKNTVLHIAVKNNQKEAVKALIAKNKKLITMTNKQNELPLTIAITQKHYKLAELLIESGSPINHLDIYGFTPLHYSVKQNKTLLTLLLLQHQADVNIQTKQGFTSLHLAAKAGNTQIIIYLLECKANTALQTNTGDTPLHLALLHKHDAVAELLISKTNLNTQNRLKNTPLHLAVFQKKSDLAKKMLYKGCYVDIKNSKGDTPLHIAAKKGYNELVKALLLYNADGRIKTANGNTALLLALLEKQYSTAELLIDIYTINMQNNKKNTALHIAVRQSHFLTVKKLINKMAKVDTINVLGDTPLHEAAIKFDHEIIKLLLQRVIMVDVKMVDVKNDQGNAPIHCAIYAGNAKNLEVMLSYNVDPNIPDKNGNIPLCMAVAAGNISMVSMLLSYHAKVDGCNSAGYTPFALAAGHGYIKIMEMLYKNGASLNTQVNNDDTPLHIASQYGHRAAVKLLLSCGAAPHIRNKQGFTPFITAAMNGHLSIVQAFIESDLCKKQDIDDAITHAKEKRKYPIVEYLEKLKKQEKTECEQIRQIQQRLRTIEQKNKECDIVIMQNSQEKIEVTDIYTPSPCYNKPMLKFFELLERKSSERKRIIKEMLNCQDHEQQEKTRLEQKLKKMRESQKQDNEQNENDQEQEANECLICFEEKTSVGPIPCKHCCKGSERICSECLKKWTKRSNKCPTCNLPTLNKDKI